jgi:hypothetical protein
MDNNVTEPANPSPARPPAEQQNQFNSKDLEERHPMYAWAMIVFFVSFSILFYQGCDNRHQMEVKEMELKYREAFSQGRNIDLEAIENRVKILEIFCRNRGS